MCRPTLNNLIIIIIRPRNAEIKIADGSILKVCEDFATALKTGKSFSFKGIVVDPIFGTPIIPPYHGLNVGRDEDHAKYIEDYTN